MQETQVPSLSWEDPLEQGMTAHSSIAAWRIPMGRGACWATVHTIAKSWTPLKCLSMHIHTHACILILGLYELLRYFAVSKSQKVFFFISIYGIIKVDKTMKLILNRMFSYQLLQLSSTRVCSQKVYFDYLWWCCTGTGVQPVRILVLALSFTGSVKSTCFLVSLNFSFLINNMVLLQTYLVDVYVCWGGAVKIVL